MANRTIRRLPPNSSRQNKNLNNLDSDSFTLRPRPNSIIFNNPSSNVATTNYTDMIKNLEKKISKLSDRVEKVSMQESTNQTDFNPFTQSMYNGSSFSMPIRDERTGTYLFPPVNQGSSFPRVNHTFSGANQKTSFPENMNFKSQNNTSNFDFMNSSSDTPSFMSDGLFPDIRPQQFRNNNPTPMDTSHSLPAFYSAPHVNNHTSNNDSPFPGFHGMTMNGFTPFPQANYSSFPFLFPQVNNQMPFPFPQNNHVPPFFQNNSVPSPQVNHIPPFFQTGGNNSFPNHTHFPFTPSDNNTTSSNNTSNPDQTSQVPKNNNVFPNPDHVFSTRSVPKSAERKFESTMPFPNPMSPNHGMHMPYVCPIHGNNLPTFPAGSFSPKSPNEGMGFGSQPNNVFLPHVMFTFPMNMAHPMNMNSNDTINPEKKSVDIVEIIENKSEKENQSDDNQTNESEDKYSEKTLSDIMNDLLEKESSVSVDSKDSEIFNKEFELLYHNRDYEIDPNLTTEDKIVRSPDEVKLNGFPLTNPTNHFILVKDSPSINGPKHLVISAKIEMKLDTNSVKYLSLGDQKSDIAKPAYVDILLETEDISQNDSGKEVSPSSSILIARTKIDRANIMKDENGYILFDTYFKAVSEVDNLKVNTLPNVKSYLVVNVSQGFPFTTIRLKILEMKYNDS